MTISREGRCFLWMLVLAMTITNNWVNAFVAPSIVPTTKRTTRSTSRITTTNLMMMGTGGSFLMDHIHHSSFLVATIDADIAKLSDNEFAPVFMGGVLVMLGGVVSTLIVGAILDSTNSYAEVIADSYVQSADDEAFWKGLSEEERKKTQELLKLVKESKEKGAGRRVGGEDAAPVDTLSAEQVSTTTTAREGNAKVEQPTSASESEKSMFSDY